MTRRQQLVLLALVPIVVIGGLVVGRALRDDRGANGGVLIGDASAADTFAYDYEIPAGTGARLDAGEKVEIVPAELVVHVGESIRIVNQDDRDHTVGAFFVAAGETLKQRFNRVGELQGECTVHPSGRFTVRVEP